VSGLDQVAKLRRRVVGSDPPEAVREEVLAILEAHSCGARSPPESVFEVVDPNLS
jgi:hypothetical protein